MKKIIYYLSPIALVPAMLGALELLENSGLLAMSPLVLFGALVIYALAAGLLSPTKKKADLLLAAVLPASLFLTLFLAGAFDNGEGMGSTFLMNEGFEAALQPLTLIGYLLLSGLSLAASLKIVRSLFSGISRLKKTAAVASLACLVLLLPACTAKDPNAALLKLPESPAEDFRFEYVDEEQTEVCITEYLGSADTVVIPEKIEGLPVVRVMGVRDGKTGLLKKGAFQQSGVKEVVVPKTVKVIWGFEGCTELTTVLFKEGSELLAIDGFENCTALSSIDLSKTPLKNVSGFEGCAALRQILLPDCVERIGERAFYNCSALEEIDLPESLERIDQDAFAGCTALERITVPAKLNMVNGMSTIPFRDLDALKEIVLEEGRERVDGYGFFEIKTSATIIIPASVKEFSGAAFFLYSPATFVFKGDLPAPLSESGGFDWQTKYTVTLRYDKSTEGWDGFPATEGIVLEPVN